MAGKGIARKRTKPTLESLRHALELNIPLLAALGVRPGTSGRAEYVHSSAAFHMDIEFDLRGEHGWLRLSHPTRQFKRAERMPIHYKVDVSMTRANLGGGWRVWLHCPDNPSRRVTQLILPEGRSRFLSRHAYGSVYETERMTKAARLVKKAQKAHKRAGGTGNWRVPPKAKPKGMHAKTWQRLLAERSEAVRLARGYPARHKRLVARRHRRRMKESARERRT